MAAAVPFVFSSDDTCFSRLCLIRSIVVVVVMVFSRIRDLLNVESFDKLVDVKDQEALRRMRPQDEEPFKLRRREDCTICHVLPGFAGVAVGAYYAFESHAEYKEAIKPKKKTTEIDYTPRKVQYLRPKAAFRVNCIVSAVVMIAGVGLIYNLRMPLINE